MRISRIGADFLWRDVRRNPLEIQRGALFIDRDGVLIEEKVYLSNPEEVRLIAGAVDLLKAAAARQIPIVVVTNQAGIARGKLDWAAFCAVEQRIESLLADLDISLDAVFACPFHEDGVGPFQIANHPWRKPNPGMLIEASGLLNLDLGRSILVGDKWTDIAAAKNAGLPRAVQVQTGHGPENIQDSLSWSSPAFQVIVGRDAAEAIVYLS